MDPNAIGQLGPWIGSLVGIVLGVGGAIFGTAMTIRNTRSPRERAFAIRASIICWVLAIVFVAAMASIPTWHKHLLWIPYAILLPFGIRAWNKAQFQIRNDESGGTG